MPDGGGKVSAEPEIAPVRAGGEADRRKPGADRLSWRPDGDRYEASLGTRLVGTVRGDADRFTWLSAIHDAQGLEPGIAEAMFALEVSVRSWLEGFRAFMDADVPATPGRSISPSASGREGDGSVGNLTCIPMADVHGSRYLGAVGEAAGGLVLDLRRFPYFDLHGLGRPASDAALARAGCRYRHSALDLREGPQDAGQWERQASRRTSFLEAVAGERGALVVLVDRERDVVALARCLRPGPGAEAGGWIVRDARGAPR